MGTPAHILFGFGRRSVKRRAGGPAVGHVDIQGRTILVCRQYVRSPDYSLELARSKTENLVGQMPIP